MSRLVAAVNSLGNYPDGTHYQVVIPLTGNAISGAPGVGRYRVNWKTDTGEEHWDFDQSWGYPGFNGSQTISFNFTVPPGKTYSVNWMVWSWQGNAPGTESNWSADTYGGFTGTAGSGEPTEVRKVTVSLRNTSGVPQTYKLMDGVTQIGSVTLQPGEGLIQTFVVDAATAANLQVVAQLNDLGFTDGQWVVEPGAVKVSTSVPAGGINNSNVHISTQPTAEQIVPVPQPPSPAAPVNGQGSGGTVWRNGAGGATDALTNTVYREGVDKITTRLDKANTQLEKLGSQADELKNLRESTISTNTMQQEGDGAKAQTEEKFSDLPVPSEKTPSKTQPDFIVNNNLLGSVDMNPFRSDRFGPIAEWFRSAFSWMLGVLLAIRVGKEAAETVKSVTNAQQAKGNAVLAGTGAQATAFTAAAIVTAIVIIGITAVVALAVSDFGFGTLTSLFSANPYSGLPSTVAWCLDQVMNLGHVTLYLLTIAVMPLLFAKINAATCAAVRFVVP